MTTSLLLIMGLTGIVAVIDETVLSENIYSRIVKTFLLIMIFRLIFKVVKAAAIMMEPIL